MQVNNAGIGRRRALSHKSPLMIGKGYQVVVNAAQAIYISPVAGMRMQKGIRKTNLPVASSFV